MRVTRWAPGWGYLSLCLFPLTSSSPLHQQFAYDRQWLHISLARDLRKRFCHVFTLCCVVVAVEGVQGGVCWLCREKSVSNPFHCLLCCPIRCPFNFTSLSLSLFLSFSSIAACSLRRNAVQGKAFLATCLLFFTYLSSLSLLVVSTRTLAWQSLHSANDWRWFVCLLNAPPHTQTAMENSGKNTLSSWWLTRQSYAKFPLLPVKWKTFKFAFVHY